MDVVSFGGTKNGLVFGEAVVFCRSELARDFEFTRKRLGQLASKMRFVSAQFEALLTGDLWLRSAGTRTRWPRGLVGRRRRDRRGRGPLPGRGERRLRPPAAPGDRAPAGRAPRRAPVLHLGRRPRRGALDVRLGHDGGRRRRVRRQRARGRRRARRGSRLRVRRLPWARLRALTSSPAQASSASSDSQEEARRATTPALDEAWYGRSGLSPLDSSATVISRCRSSAARCSSAERAQTRRRRDGRHVRVPGHLAQRRSATSRSTSVAGVRGHDRR